MAAPPPTGNPDWVPTWGNREETNVQLPAGVVVGLRPIVDAISGVPVCSIDQSDGRTIGADQPFGGIVTVTGFIPGAPDISATPMKYRVRVRDVDNGGSFKALTNDFGITVTQQVGASLPVQLPMTQSTDPDDFYTYLVAGAGWRRVVGNVLAVWSTSVPMTGRWEVEVVAKDPMGTIHSAQTILCVDGTTRANVRLRLDEVAPTSSFSITHFIRGGTTFPAQECMKFKLGDILVGAYAVSDQHFRRLALELDPAGPAAGATPTISGPSTFPLAPTAGTSGTWSSTPRSWRRADTCYASGPGSARSSTATVAAGRRCRSRSGRSRPRPRPSARELFQRYWSERHTTSCSGRMPLRRVPRRRRGVPKAAQQTSGAAPSSRSRAERSFLAGRSPGGPQWSSYLWSRRQCPRLTWRGVRGG